MSLKKSTTSAPGSSVEGNKEKLSEIDYYTIQLKVAANYAEKNFRKRARRMVNLYELNHYKNHETGENMTADYDRIKVAYPYSNARQILAEIYVKTPEPIVLPTKKNQVEMADPMSGQMTMGKDYSSSSAKMKAILLHIIKKSAFKQETKMAVLDGIVTGVGCVMITPQKSSKVPLYTRILFHDLLWAADVTDVYKSSWIARRLVRPLKDIREDESYAEGIREKVAPSKLDKTLQKDLVGDIEYGVLWDVWDKKKDRHIVFADGGKEYLLEQKVSEVIKLDTISDEFAVEWPLVFYINEETLQDSFGMGDIAPIESQVYELDKIRTMKLTHIKRFLRKYMAKKGFLDDQSMQQLKYPEDGTVVEVTQDILPSNFQAVADAPLPADVFRAETDVQNDIQLISPIGPNSLTRGVGAQPDTLGQSQIIEQNTDTRLGEKRDKVSDFFGRLFRYTAQYVQQYWVESDEILITGDGSKPSDWLEYDPSQISGEFDYDINPESLRDNTAIYRKQLQEVTTLLAPFLATGVPIPPALAVILRKLVESYPSLAKDVDQIIPEPTDPGAGMMGGPEEELMNLIDGASPDQVVDIMNRLPENERTVLEATITRMQGSVSPGTPSASALTGSTNTVRL